MSLTDTKVKNARPAEKAVKLADGFSLYRFKYWQSGYRFDGKQKVFSIGVYLAISLADARQRRDEAKRLLAQGIDPNAKNRLMKKSFRKSAIKPARPVSSPKADAP
ncbi:putative P4-type integrase [Salmonella enterica subsp. enterica serovar Braenderup]|nr:putative P4-type integrase [Salmonella enterica subsp. enterica serovar Braenderup]